MPYSNLSPTRTTSGCGCSTCKTCDSLQSLSRPRFFAGQLLTDADFRRLDAYIVGKSRLHNRFLHGTGVVCGLEVVCSNCDDGVTVRPGYALGPCGEDIVVCDDYRVDVGELIRAQRHSRARSEDCGPYTNPLVDDNAPEEQWVLGICYDEQPAKPVRIMPTAARHCGCGASKSPTGASGCGCGGSKPTAGTGGCGCDGVSTRSSSIASADTPAGCQPTVIQEGFRFTVTRLTPAGERERQRAWGALAEKLREALVLIMSNLSKAKNATADPNFWRQFKADLQYVLDTGIIHDCTLRQRLAVVQVGRKAKEDLLPIAEQMLRSVLSSVLLPACPDSCEEDCVPLATLTVNTSDLRVLRVCNWSSRRFAITAPMLEYWLSALPFEQALRGLVTRLFCPEGPAARRDLNQTVKVKASHPEMASNRRATPWATFARFATAPVETTETIGGHEAGPSAADLKAFAELPAFVRIAADYIRNPSPMIGLQSTLLDGLGLLDDDRPASVSEAEQQNPGIAILLSQLLGPEGLGLGAPIRSMLSTAGDVDLAKVATILSSLGSEEVVTKKEDGTVRFEKLELTIAALQKKVTTQARTIATLRKEMKQ